MTNVEQLLEEAKLRNIELKVLHSRKEMEFERLVQENSNIKREIKRQEAMRLSQLEFLALRNIELEKLMLQVRSNATACKQGVCKQRERKNQFQYIEHPSSTEQHDLKNDVSYTKK